MKGGLQNQLWHSIDNTETSQDQNLQTCGSRAISCTNSLCPPVTFTLRYFKYIPAVCNGLLENIEKYYWHIIDPTESQWFAPPNVITSATPIFQAAFFSLQMCFGSEWPTGVFAQDLELNYKKCV